MNKLTFLFGAAVALVVLIDLATGQGPPVYTQYLQAQQQSQAYPPAPPAIALHPVGYVPHRAEYEPKKLDKDEYEKELGKEGGYGKHGPGHHKQQLKKNHQDKSEYEKIEKKGKGEYKDKEEKEYYDDEYKSTPAPGVLSSFSNSMSGAWNRISNLGRSTRSVDELKEPAAAGNATFVESKPDAAGAEAGKSSQARGMDSYELLHQKSNGYIYFKVPKHLVCNY